MPAPTHPAPSGPSAHGALALKSETALARYARFDDVVELIRLHRDVKLLIEVETNLRLVSYSPGRIAFEPTEAAAKDLAAKLGGRLQAWTGVRWGVSIASGGAPTIAEVRDAEVRALRDEAEAHPLVQEVLRTFPEAKIIDVRARAEIEAQASVEALQEVEDEWDPFEED